MRSTRTSAEALAWVYAMNTNRRLVGAVSLVDLLRADPDVSLVEIADPPRRVHTNADLEEVARLMTDFDLTVVPVVDEREQMIGVITVDDVLELVLPKGWRRRFGLLGDE